MSVVPKMIRSRVRFPETEVLLPGGKVGFATAYFLANTDQGLGPGGQVNIHPAPKLDETKLITLLNRIAFSDIPTNSACLLYTSDAADE